MGVIFASVGFFWIHRTASICHWRTGVPSMCVRSLGKDGRRSNGCGNQDKPRDVENQKAKGSQRGAPSSGRLLRQIVIALLQTITCDLIRLASQNSFTQLQLSS